MPRVFPFDALVYDEAVVGALRRVTTPPYDVISEVRRREYETEPLSIVRIDLGAGSDAAGDEGTYASAAALLRRWIDDGVLVHLPPAFHAYEMRFGMEGRVRGVLCGMELEPWGGAVLPHERTMSAPLDDRLRLLRATNTHLSAVYGTVAGPCPQLADLLDDVTGTPPDAEVVDAEGVTHRRWVIPGDPSIEAWLSEEPLLIADGHHRYTTALAYRDERRDRRHRPLGSRAHARGRRRQRGHARAPVPPSGPSRIRPRRREARGGPGRADEGSSR
jgi:uncharacterized protein (DUF1015 family)